MQKRALFLGAAYAQIPVLEEAKSRGWYIITCDYLPNNPGHSLADESYDVSTTDFEKVLQLAKKVKPDFVIAYASDPAAPTAAWVSEQLGLLGNSYKSIQLLSEKDLFRQFLTENGFNSPKAISISRSDDLNKLKTLEFPIIIKPTDSSGSKGVTRVDFIEQAEQAIRYALTFSRNNRIIAEEFIECDGNQLHGDGFVVNGKLVFCYLGDQHYNKKINPFVPYSTTWPSTKSEAIISKIEKEIQKAITLSEFKNGPINIEVRLSNSGKIYIMEIGPRSGGNFVPQIIKYATNFDMVKTTLDYYENVDINVDCQNYKREYSAYYVIHNQLNGILGDIKLDPVLDIYIKEFHQYIKPGEKVKSFQGANAAIGVLLLLFNSWEEMDFYIENMNKFITLKVEKD